jgi:hypothetical protein
MEVMCISRENLREDIEIFALKKKKKKPQHHPFFALFSSWSPL